MTNNKKSDILYIIIILGGNSLKLLAIDGNSIINRAFYGIKLLSTKDGRYTNAVYGFINILNRLLEKENPDCVAVAFDLKAPTFRHKMYDAYKAGRHATPEELLSQFAPLSSVLVAYPYDIDNPKFGFLLFTS